MSRGGCESHGAGEEVGGRRPSPWRRGTFAVPQKDSERHHLERVMKRHKVLSIATIGALLASCTTATLVPSAEGASESDSQGAPQTLVRALEGIAWTNEVVLSNQDEAVLHNTFFASDVFSGTNLLTGAPVPSARVISLASVVLVEEKWEPSIWHVFETVDARGAEDIFIEADYTGANYLVTVHPVSGIKWGTVSDIDDLEFVPTRISRD